MKKNQPTKVQVLQTNYNIFIAFVLFLAAVTFLALQSVPVPPGAEITNFDECVAAGYPVMESYPRQCAVPGNGSFTEKITDYYGSSTNGPCTISRDCIITGCNSEICQSRNEEQMASICIAPERPTPGQVGYECACVNGQCQWS